VDYIRACTARKGTVPDALFQRQLVLLLDGNASDSFTALLAVSRFGLELAGFQL